MKRTERTNKEKKKAWEQSVYACGNKPHLTVNMKGMGVCGGGCST